MSTLIRNARVEVDDYSTLADDAALPAQGRLIVSWTRWQKEGESLKEPARYIGVRIPNTLDLAIADPALLDRPLIALEFPAFADGRAYSQARLLRDRYGYRGEIRATGAAVVRDQMFGMARCGISSFELRADQDPQVCLTAFVDFTKSYQPAADERTIVARRRAGA